MSPSLKVAIIGGGPAGLILARLLRLSDITVTVFELDKSPSFRSKGGTLDLHPDGGLLAVRRAQLWPTFLQHARYDAGDLIITDKKCKEFLNFPGGDGEEARPEIDRCLLRKILLDSLPEGTIRWDSKLLSVEEDGTLHFAHGREKNFDLIVGADGAWSKVRPLLSPAEPLYTGISGVDFQITNVDERNPSVADLVGKGSYFACSDGKTIISQRNGDGSVKIYAWGIRPEAWTEVSEIDFHNAAQVKEKMLADYADWSPRLTEMISGADEEGIIPHRLYMLPVEHRWTSRPGFTLIGDAAHLMGPWAGEGVNIAMTDAVELADHIAKWTEASANKASNEEIELTGDRASLTAAVRRFEEGMFCRAERSASETYENMKGMFADDGPKGFVDRITQLITGEWPRGEGEGDAQKLMKDWRGL